MPDIEVFDYNEDGLKDLKITHRYSQENNKKEGPKEFNLEVLVQKKDGIFKRILIK